MNRIQKIDSLQHKRAEALMKGNWDKVKEYDSELNSLRAEND